MLKSKTGYFLCYLYAHDLTLLDQSVPVAAETSLYPTMSLLCAVPADPALWNKDSQFALTLQPSMDCTLKSIWTAIWHFNAANATWKELLKLTPCNAQSTS